MGGFGVVEVVVLGFCRVLLGGFGCFWPLARDGGARVAIKFRAIARLRSGFFSRGRERGGAPG